MKVKSTSETEGVKVISLTGQDIINLLFAKAGEMLKFDESSVKFHVPGGGDYSNMDLDITEEDPIVVTIKTKL